MRESQRPSLQFCLTGCLAHRERYHQEVHSYYTFIRDRCPNILEFYRLDEIEDFVLRKREVLEAILSAEQIEEIDNLLWCLSLDSIRAELAQ